MSIRDSLSERRVSGDSRGVQIRRLGDGCGFAFRWSDVVRVRAFKIDLFSFDQVRVSFATADGVEHEISEDDDGFAELMAVAQRGLVGLPSLDQWKPGVVAGPFAKSETALWSHEAGCRAEE